MQSKVQIDQALPQRRRNHLSRRGTTVHLTHSRNGIMSKMPIAVTRMALSMSSAFAQLDLSRYHSMPCSWSLPLDIIVFATGFDARRAKIAKKILMTPASGRRSGARYASLKSARSIRVLPRALSEGTSHSTTLILVSE